jgi:hypothetical protein
VLGNSFFGYQAGESTTSGYTNTFVGAWSGRKNTTGFSNTFVARLLAASTRLVDTTHFIGDGTGHFNAMGERNTFVGSQAGFYSLGSSNTYVGMGTGSGGIATRDRIEQHAAWSRCDCKHSERAIRNGDRSGCECFQQFDHTRADRPVRTCPIPGNAVVETLSTGGITQLCRNAFFILATCSSSARYKSNITPFRLGMISLKSFNLCHSTGKKAACSISAGRGRSTQIEPLLTDLQQQR